MKGMHMIAFALAMVGALNWGLIGLAGLMGNDPMSWNVVSMVLGSWPTLEWIVYLLVGVSAVWLVIQHKKDCRHCGSGMM